MINARSYRFMISILFFFSSRRRHTRFDCDWSSDVCSSDLYRVQEDLIWLAKAALVLGNPRTVLDLLDGQAAQTDWFRDQVSFRLGYTAQRLAAMARGELGQRSEERRGGEEWRSRWAPYH